MRGIAILCAVLLALGPVSAQNSPESTNSASQNQSKVKAHHDGSLQDIDAIGNRNVGCKQGVGNWYSLDKQVAMGRSYAEQVESTSKLITDPVVTEYVNRIGQNLVRNSDAQVPFTIKILDSDDINAFALPGGFFYVDSGLLVAAENEAELAGVMAHEIAHVSACHAAREMSRGQLMQMASIALIFVGGGIGYAVQQIAGLAMPMGFLKFTRSFETEADYLGVEYMYKAGYDPQALTAFFEKVKALEKHKPGTLAKAFDTHPQTPDRIQKTQQEINTLLPPLPEYKLDTSEFEEVKTRMMELENRHGVDYDRSRPSLHRPSHPSGDSTDSGDQSDKGDQDDTPTLKRRNPSSQ
ncbi:MAG TPA: M48 family metallopeptidase [Terriglobales bacterium]|nr:M48 family metallopeptidase [Terriglobales bacterium]